MIDDANEIHYTHYIDILEQLKRANHILELKICFL